MAALRLNRTGFAVAIDLGDLHSPVTPIHPRRKQEVGRRLALSALSVQYGRHDIVSTGPTFASIAIAGSASNTATVSFAAGTAGGLHHAGTADCDLVGSKLCCGESPFEVQLGNGTWQRTNYTFLQVRAQSPQPL
jgi:sialate O-acetylesterase